MYTFINLSKKSVHAQNHDKDTHSTTFLSFFHNWQPKNRVTT